MSKLLSWIVTLPLALVIIVFSLGNRGPVAIDFWPLPAVVEIPLFALILVILMIGVLWGGIGAWLAASRARARGREASRRAETAEMETRDLEERNTRLQSDLADAQANLTDAQAKMPQTALLPPADAA